MAYRNRQPVLCLTGAAETDDFIDTLAVCLETAGLNDYYPSYDPLLNSLDMMMPASHHGLHETLELHAETGLPTYKAFVRVLSDWQNAKEELPRLARWRDEQGEDIYGKMARKYRYYDALCGRRAVLAESKKICFRKIERATATALFRVVLDRITPGGYLERLTVEMGQRDQLWGARELTVNHVDAVEMSESLMGIVYRMASQPPEVVFLQLNERDGLGVSSVIKGRIGPFLYPGTTPAAQFAPLEAVRGKDGAVLTVSVQIADTAQQADVFNDPFVTDARFSLQARKELSEVGRSELFHVMTDRKFILADGNRAALERFLGKSKTGNIIYEVNAW